MRLYFELLNDTKLILGEAGYDVWGDDDKHRELAKKYLDWLVSESHDPTQIEVVYFVQRHLKSVSENKPVKRPYPTRGMGRKRPEGND